MRIQVFECASSSSYREVRFDQLSLDRLFGVLDVEVADELLGDRRGALDRACPGLDVLQRGADDRRRVDRAVVEEAPVLDRDRRLLEVLGQLRRGDRLADVAGADEADQAAVGGVDRRGAALLDRLQAGERRRRVVDVDRPGAGGARRRPRARPPRTPRGTRIFFHFEVCDLRRRRRVRRAIAENCIEAAFPPISRCLSRNIACVDIARRLESRRTGQRVQGEARRQERPPHRRLRLPRQGGARGAAAPRRRNRRLLVVLRADDEDAARRRLLEEVLVAEPFAGLDGERGVEARLRRRPRRGRRGGRARPGRGSTPSSTAPPRSPSRSRSTTPSRSTRSGPPASSSGCAGPAPTPTSSTSPPPTSPTARAARSLEDGLPHHAVAGARPRADAGRSAPVAGGRRARVASRAAGLALRQGGDAGRGDARGPRRRRAGRGAAPPLAARTALAPRAGGGRWSRAGPTPTRSARRWANGC